VAITNALQLEGGARHLASCSAICAVFGQICTAHAQKLFPNFRSNYYIAIRYSDPDFFKTEQ